MKKRALEKSYEQLLREHRDLETRHNGLVACLSAVLPQVAKDCVALIDLFDDFADYAVAELNADMICGRWVDPCNPTHTATIYKAGAGWHLVVFQGRKIASRHIILLDDEGLHVCCREGSVRQSVIHCPEGASLTLGSLGLFLRDDNPQIIEQAKKVE